eukprot:2709825-Rhodomonas_salina.1
MGGGRSRAFSAYALPGTHVCMVLRTCGAMSGTDSACGTVRSLHMLLRAWCGTETVYGTTTVLRHTRY